MTRIKPHNASASLRVERRFGVAGSALRGAQRSFVPPQDESYEPVLAGRVSSCMT